MKLLVTGGVGFIGSAVIRQAVSEGHFVVNVDALTYAGDLANVATVEADRRYAFEYADIADAEAMAAIFERHQPDAVLHLAAESHVDRSIDGPMVFVRTNIAGTAVLLETARAYYERMADHRRRGFRFHHVSTDEVFGTLGETGAFDEASPYRPNSPYSASKASADMLVRAWGQTFGLPVIITNTSNNYGPFQHPEKLIPTVILKGLAGLPIPVYGDGRQVRDWLYVHDHAEALLSVMMKGRVGETYCIGGEAERTNIDLVQLVCAELDKTSPRSWPHDKLIRHVADRPGHDQRYALSNAKITAELGWKPRVTLEAGIARTLRWYLDNEEWLRGAIAKGAAGDRLGLRAAS